MTDFDSHNQRAIDRLNQRGGRMLSLVDLVEAETLPADAAALMAWVAAHSGSLVTAAGPGGVGKSTLLGGYLGFLPAEIEIVTVDSARALIRPVSDSPECLLIHEINNAAYAGYIWGPEVGRFFSMNRPGRCVAATVHAETYRELVRKLTGPPLAVRRPDVMRVDLVAFIAMDGVERRVTAIWLSDGEQHRQVLSFEGRAGTFRMETGATLHRVLASRFKIPAAAVEKELALYADLLGEAVRRDVRRLELLRGLARQRM